MVKHEFLICKAHFIRFACPYGQTPFFSGGHFLKRHKGIKGNSE